MTHRRSWLWPATLAIAFGCTTPPDGLDDDDLDQSLAPATTFPTSVATTSGTVNGTASGAVVSWTGIPYAEPPIGSLRWAPPVMIGSSATPIDATPTIEQLFDNLQAATTEPEQAAAYLAMKTCSQTETDVETGSAAYFGSEDCLYLNVFRPSTSATKLPIIVFLHPGYLTHQTASASLFDGSTLAGSNNAIVVTVNYRLGALGFLAHPALDSTGSNGASGHYAAQDAELALQWVQNNAAAFGGDAHNVTLWGQSAGAVLTNVLVQRSGYNGANLFQHAIVESAPDIAFSPALYELYGTTYPTQQTAEQQSGEPFAQSLGCSTAACLRGLSAEQIILGSIETTPSSIGSAGTTSTTTDEQIMLPPIDGTYLQHNPTSGDYLARRGIDVILGSTTNELGITVITNIEGETTPARSPQDVYAAVARAWGSNIANTPGLVSSYLAQYGSDYETAAIQIVSDGAVTCPTAYQAYLLAGSGFATYRYDFAQVLTGPAHVIGAAHGVDLLYAFENWVASNTGPYAAGSAAYDVTPQDLALSATIRSLWTSFAAGGAPSAAGAPAWTPYTSASAASGPTMTLVDSGSASPAIDDSYAASQCARWDQLGLWQ